MMKKEQLLEKTICMLESQKCTGCGTCYNSCSQNAICMKENFEGFWVPELDEEKCNLCGLCKKNCPELMSPEFGLQYPECYAVWAEDDLREKSSSGGMFGLCANLILKRNGFVCGAKFSEDFRSVYHSIIDCNEELDDLLRSKYVQSNTLLVFKQIQELLNETDRPILFCGTPCQVAGLTKFIGKNHERLYTLDFVCHGVPSPKAYRMYIDEIVHDKIQQVNFRPKDKGWHNSIRVKVETKKVDNTKAMYTEERSGSWYTAFLKGFSIGKFCSSCQYAKVPRVGDLTIGDFWGIESHDEKLGDPKGTSLVLVNTKKGERLFESLQNSMRLCEKQSLQIAIDGNWNLHTTSNRAPMRECFFKHLDEHGFHKSLRYAQQQLMDIGLICWWYIVNYGSRITSYALYKFLERQDFSVAMICAPDRSKYWPAEENEVLPFARKNYRITTFRNTSNVYELNDYIDTFIIGSDQLWNYWSDYSHFVMLDFVEDGKKKIAYSTSFGHERGWFPPRLEKEVACYMKRLDYISVREKSAIKVIERFGLTGEVLLDPVFLIEKEEYLRISNEALRTTTEPYIFTYIMDPNEAKLGALREITSKLELTNVSIPDRQKEYHEKVNIMKEFGVIEQASLEEWLWHFAHADFVFTDSFHGLCFALIFEKPFICVSNIMRGNTRFESMMDLLSLKNRFLYDPSDICGESELLETLMNGIDYKAVNEILNIEKERAKAWLLDALEAKKEDSVTELDMIKRENNTLRKRIIALEESLRIS